MKLSYRGVSYDYNPVNPVKAENSKPPVDLKYRGASYRWGQVASAERLGAIFRYRGLSYGYQPTSQPSETTSATPTPQVALSVEDRTRWLNLNHNREVRNRHHAMLARLAAEVGISGNLSDYWNNDNEWATSPEMGYGRSNAALS